MQPRTVLIVEDERDANDLMAELVRARNDRAIQVFEGASVVDAVEANEPDLILLDVMLPDVDGYELCARLKRRRATNLIPIIMVTALQTENNRVHGVRVGANEYLTKPFTPTQLFEVMDRAFAWREEHKTRGTAGEIHFDLRSETDYLAELNDLLTDLYEHTPLTERQIKDLKQALMEMGSNAIEWGHRKDAELVLRITYRIESDNVTLIILDQGPGFDPGHVPHAAQADDPIAHLDVRNELGIREGGFGIMLARGLVDEFRYNDKGNEVTLVKRFESTGVPGLPDSE